jgi:hypothetical protein
MNVSRRIKDDVAGGYVKELSSRARPLKGATL